MCYNLIVLINYFEVILKHKITKPSQYRILMLKKQPQHQ